MQHAVVEEIAGALQIFFGKIEAFGRARAAGTLQGDDAGHRILADAEHVPPLAAQFVFLGAGQPLQIFYAGESSRIKPGPLAAVQGRVPLAVDHQTPQGFSVAAIEIGTRKRPVAKPQAPGGPDIQRTALHAGCLPRYRGVPSAALRL